MTSTALQYGSRQEMMLGIAVLDELMCSRRYHIKHCRLNGVAKELASCCSVMYEYLKFSVAKVPRSCTSDVNRPLEMGSATIKKWAGFESFHPISAIALRGFKLSAHM